MGFVFQDMAEWPRAIELYEQQLALVREFGTHAEQAGVIGRMGLVHQSMGNSRRAMELHERQAESEETSTSATHSTRHSDLSPSIATINLRFYVSRDQEHVRVEAVDGDQVLALGERASFYLLLLLARERRRFVGDASLPESEQGWCRVVDLMNALAIDERHLNVTVYRLREVFAKAGIPGAIDIVQRRPQQIRIGTGRTEEIAL